MASRNMFTTLTARDLNYMIFRYIQESGFQNSANIFGHEAGIDNENDIDPTLVPPGAAVTFITKGIQYLEMEANLKIDDKDEADDFEFIKPFDLISKSVDELKQMVEEQKELRAVKGLEDLRKGKEIVAVGGSEPTSLTPWPRGRLRGVRSSDVLVLAGHSAEVYACAWSPAGLTLATGSGDGTARIWNIEDRTNSTSNYNRMGSVHVLKHSNAEEDAKGKDITTLDWNTDGTLLATGSQDGLVGIWNTNGVRESLLVQHRGPVLSVSWRKKGEYLLTGGFDRTAIVWDVKANKLKQQFKYSGSVLDVDWRTNRAFATGLTDGMIYVSKVGENQPIKLFYGHKDDVNCVKWDPTSMLLASCSDDTTAKIWSMTQDMPICDFKDHTKEIFKIKWSPTGPETDNPNMMKLLASASFDSTVKLWDVESGQLYRSLDGHRDAVYCLSFSPNGEYLATGSGDKMVNIWSIKNEKIVKTFFCKGSVSQVSWNREGNKIAYATRKNSVCISDFRM